MTDGRGPTASDDERDLDRLVFFSDAVFAIAITLLVLNLQLPDLPGHATSDDIVAAVSTLVPAIYAYALSFATIGLYWLGHWRRFRLIERADYRLAALNLLLLGLIAFIPFPTTVIGEHGDRAAAVVLYACSIAAAGLAGSAEWAYARRAKLTRPDLDRDQARYSLVRGIAVPIVMLASLPLLLVLSPGTVELTWILIIPLQRLIYRWAAGGSTPSAVGTKTA